MNLSARGRADGDRKIDKAGKSCHRKVGESMKYIHESNRIYSTDETGKVIAEITFPRTAPGVYTIEHTIVDSSLRGQGIAGKLVQAAVDEIESRGGEVRATCSYAVEWLGKHNL